MAAFHKYGFEPPETAGQPAFPLWGLGLGEEPGAGGGGRGATTGTACVPRPPVLGPGQRPGEVFREEAAVAPGDITHTQDIPRVSSSHKSSEPAPAADKTSHKTQAKTRSWRWPHRPSQHSLGGSTPVTPRCHQRPVPPLGIPQEDHAVIWGLHKDIPVPESPLH